jgi:hypothetical protein
MSLGSVKARRAHRLYARANGFFWIPCPLCGEMFGGHEYHSGSIPSTNPDTPTTSHGVCGDHDDDPRVDHRGAGMYDQRANGNHRAVPA